MFKISIDDKPNLKRALDENPVLAKEVISAFVKLIEESFDESKSIAWSKLHKELSSDLSFHDMIAGILRGALDVEKMNPDTFDVLKSEVHPLSILSPRKNYIDGGVKYYDWRSHFQLSPTAAVNAETVENIVRKLFRYSRYVDIQTLAEHLQANQIATYRGLGDEQVKKLPFFPALRYQQRTSGDLQVGKFLDSIGFFDCGENLENYCLACNRYDLQRINEYKVCLACNAGYVEGGDKHAADHPSSEKN